MVSSKGQRRGGKTFQDLLATDLKTGEFRPVYLLIGPDDYRIEAVVEHIKKAALGEGGDGTFNDHVFQGDECDLSHVLQQAETYPMFGSRQVVWLKHVEECVSNQDAGDALMRYIQQPVDQTILILTGASLDKRRKWVKALAQHDVLFEFPNPKGNALRTWVRRAAQRANLDIDAETADTLVQLVGNDLRALSGEIDKLTLLAEDSGRKLSGADILKVVMDQAELQVFDLSNAIEPGNSVGALHTWFRLAEWGKSAYELAPLIIFRFKQAALVAQVREDGLNDQEMAQRTGLSSWVLNKQIMPMVNRLDAKRLAAALADCARCDRALKSSPLKPEIHLERMIISLGQVNS